MKLVIGSTQYFTCMWIQEPRPLVRVLNFLQGLIILKVRAVYRPRLAPLSNSRICVSEMQRRHHLVDIVHRFPVGCTHNNQSGSKALFARSSSISKQHRSRILTDIKVEMGAITNGNAPEQCWLTVSCKTTFIRSKVA